MKSIHIVYIYIINFIASHFIIIIVIQHLCQADATSYFGTNVQEKQVYLDWVANDRNDFYKKCLFLESSLSSADFPHGAALHWSTNATHVSVAERNFGFFTQLPCQ